MTTSPQRVFLHVGLYKTGTTHLQNLMRTNRRRLARRGIYVPPGARKTVFAALDLIPRPGGAGDVRVPGAWDRLVAEVNSSGLPCAVVSQERLSVASPRQARRAVASLAPAEVSVLVTVRDLARVLVSHWQEEVKNGATWTLEEYAAAVRDPLAVGTNPARGFWMHEDVTAVLRAWGSAVPVERIHVVTVPPPGAPRDLLADRFGSVVGFGAADLPNQEFWSNENVGLVGTELLRRLNQRLDGRLERAAHDRGVKVPLTRALAELPGRRSPDLWEHVDWAAQVAARFADEIRAGGYDVVGDLADLVPAGVGGGGGSTAPVGDAELLDAALAGLAELASRHGELLAAQDRETAAQRGDLGGRRHRAAVAVRSAGVAAQRAVADRLAGTGAGRRLAGAYMRRRAGR